MFEKVLHSVHYLKINLRLCSQSRDQQMLLGVFIDNKLTFDKHTDDLCTKASLKLSALNRVSSFTSTNKKRLVMKNPSFLRIWSHLLKKSLMENFIFCAM